MPCPASNEIINKVSVYTYFHLQSFGLGKSNQAQWTSIFLKTQLRNYLCLVDMEVPSDQVGTSSRGKKGAHCIKFENNNQIEEKMVCFAESSCSCRLFYQWSNTLAHLNGSTTTSDLLHHCSNAAKHWASEIAKNWASLLEKRRCGDGCGPR